MQRTLALVTKDDKVQKLEMIVISWIHNKVDDRYIEISAKNAELGQRLVRIKTSGAAGDQTKLSEFHDKLLSALAGFNTQITAYTELPALPPNNIDIDLKKMLVYLIIDF
jgi:hypothetical protein